MVAGGFAENTPVATAGLSSPKSGGDRYSGSGNALGPAFKPGRRARGLSLLSDAVRTAMRFPGMWHSVGVPILALEPQRGSRSQPGVAQRTPGIMPASMAQP